jgi:hypothetical protein
LLFFETIADTERTDLGANMQALTAAEDGASVFVTDTRGTIEQSAHAALEGRKAPEVIHAALEAGCHVLVRKPSRIRSLVSDLRKETRDDIDPPARESVHRLDHRGGRSSTTGISHTLARPHPPHG